MVFHSCVQLIRLLTANLAIIGFGNPYRKWSDIPPNKCHPDWWRSLRKHLIIHSLLYSTVAHLHVGRELIDSKWLAAQTSAQSVIYVFANCTFRSTSTDSEYAETNPDTFCCGRLSTSVQWFRLFRIFYRCCDISEECFMVMSSYIGSVMTAQTQRLIASMFAVKSNIYYWISRYAFPVMTERVTWSTHSSARIKSHVTIRINDNCGESKFTITRRCSMFYADCITFIFLGNFWLPVHIRLWILILRPLNWRKNTW